MSEPKRSLILAGGGYKVAFQAGVLQVWLDEAGLEFDHADGASRRQPQPGDVVPGHERPEIADNWRTREAARRASASTGAPGGSCHWADSLLTLDRFRRNLLPRWGLDWERIRATEREATFNVYDFTDP